jgi:predicted P-loop ATPase
MSPANTQPESMAWTATAGPLLLPTDDTPVLDAALHYAWRGWRVVPLHSVGDNGACSCGRSTCRRGGKDEKSIAKHPRLPDWHGIASTDERIIRAWWAKWPNANVGIATGSGSKVIGLDIDVHRDKPGFASLAKLVTELGPLPATLTVKTGSGGEHRYFVAPSDVGQLRNSSTWRGHDGVDWRGDGGQLVVPPSITPAGRYRWQDRAAAIAELPRAWLDAHSRRSESLALSSSKRRAGASDVNAADLAEDERILSQMQQAANAEKFKTLWEGEWLALGYASQSEADAALCTNIAFWADPLAPSPDPNRVDRLFRRSGLYRDKWERDAYRRRTISYAIKMETERRATQQSHCASERPLSASIPNTGASPPGRPERSRIFAGLDEPRFDPREQDAPTDAALGRPLSNSYLSVLTVIRENRAGILRGKLEFDEMRRCPTLARHELRDVDVSEIRAEIERRIPVAWENGEPVEWLVAGSGDVHAAVLQVASAAPYQPVREYLDKLAWDGVPRLVLLPSQALRADNTELNRALIRRWAISAVARPMQPGCKVDTVLVLVGKQGAGKSSAFRALAGPWFGDTAIDVQSKDAFATLQRAWVQEWSELESLRRARGAETVKAFLSTSVDTYRPPYGRLDVAVPRTSVIVGTTNRAEFLADETGSRRFWPVSVGLVDLEWLKTNRDQLWAEAVAALRAGEQWWLTAQEERLLAQRHEEHAITDAWEDAVLAFAAKPGCTTLDSHHRASFVALPLSTPNILQHALNKPTGQWTRADEMRVGAVLTRAGYVKERPHRGPRVWRKP